MLTIARTNLLQHHHMSPSGYVLVARARTSSCQWRINACIARLLHHCRLDPRLSRPLQALRAEHRQPALLHTRAQQLRLMEAELGGQERFAHTSCRAGWCRQKSVPQLTWNETCRYQIPRVRQFRWMTVVHGTRSAGLQHETEYSASASDGG